MGIFERIDGYFINHPEYDGITGIVKSDNSEMPSRFKWDSRAGKVNRWNVWQRGMSVSLFLKLCVVKNVGAFDNSLGLGANSPYQSGEETDYLLRALRARFVIEYIPDLVVYHPDALPDYKAEKQKAYNYGVGMGYVMKKNRYPFLYSIWKCFRPCLAAGKSVFNDINRAKYFLAVSRGRFTGLLFDPNINKSKLDSS